MPGNTDRRGHLSEGALQAARMGRSRLQLEALHSVFFGRSLRRAGGARGAGRRHTRVFSHAALIGALALPFGADWRAAARPLCSRLVNKTVVSMNGGRRKPQGLGSGAYRVAVVHSLRGTTSA